MPTRFGIVSLPVAALLGLTAVLLISCGGQGRGSGGEASGGESSGGRGAGSLKAWITLNEGSYAMGEPVVMTLEVANTTGRTVTLTFPSAQRYDFVVKRGKETVWQWSDGRMFAQVVGRHEMASGDTITYRYTWNQKGSDGTNPALGAYTIEGMLMISPPVRTGTKTFGIVD